MKSKEKWSTQFLYYLDKENLTEKKETGLGTWLVRNK